MVKSLDVRSIALSHYESGKNAPEIANLLANTVHRSTVDRWIHRYEQSGSIEVKKKSGRPRTGRTKRLINLVKKRLESKIPRKSLRTMAQDFKSNTQTIKRVLNLDLKKKCYRKLNVQSLKEDQKPKRKACCQWIRKNFNSSKVKRMMFTDEKVFTKNGFINPKNDVVWADDRSDANEHGGIHQSEKYPVSVMVGLGATWNGITRPYFFAKGERLNGDMYCEHLLPFYKKEGDLLFGHTNWGFQQDGASSHTVWKAQEWCKNNFKFFIPKNRWPPNSPEVNPLDYSIWTQISSQIDYKKIKTIGDLRREIKKTTKKIDMKYVRDVIDVFLPRIRSVEQKNGKLIIDDHS